MFGPILQVFPVIIIDDYFHLSVTMILINKSVVCFLNCFTIQRRSDNSPKYSLSEANIRHFGIFNLYNFRCVESIFQDVIKDY